MNPAPLKPIRARLDRHQASDDITSAPAADPRADRPDRCRPKGKADRLLRLLDSLECEQPKSNRRWKH